MNSIQTSTVNKILLQLLQNVLNEISYILFSFNSLSLIKNKFSLSFCGLSGFKNNQ